MSLHAITVLYDTLNVKKEELKQLKYKQNSAHINSNLTIHSYTTIYSLIQNYA